MSHAAPTVTDLAAFRSLQALAYQCAEEVAASLAPGVTERQAATRMSEWLAARGVVDFFHKPFAWFGARTALRWRNPLAFFPTDLALRDGQPFILDVAPMRAGYVADVGYSGCLGASPVHAQLLADLEAHRALILDGVRERRRLSDIYDAVGRLAQRQGYDVRHAAYPGAVLAHELGRIPEGLPSGRHSRTMPPSGRRSRTIAPRFTLGFGRRALGWLGRRTLEGLRDGSRPLWNGSRASAHAPTPGLWAVEPHLAFRDVGAKFEELLVVTASDAYWLDDDLPHVRRWREPDAPIASSASSSAAQAVPA